MFKKLYMPCSDDGEALGLEVPAVCDFACEDRDEPLILWANLGTGHQWAFHRSCLEANLLLMEESLE